MDLAINGRLASLNSSLSWEPWLSSSYWEVLTSLFRLDIISLVIILNGLNTYMMKELSMMEKKYHLTLLSTKLPMKSLPSDKMRLKEFGQELSILIILVKSDLLTERIMWTSSCQSTTETQQTASNISQSLQEQLSLGSQVQRSRLSNMFQMVSNTLQRMTPMAVPQSSCMTHVSLTSSNIRK